MTDLASRLRALGLTLTADTLADVIALGTKKRWGPTELLEYVADIEDKECAKRGLEGRTRRSKLERFKLMADFDWNWPKEIDRPLVNACLGLEFLDDHRNVVLVSPQGLGKTMIAKNIAHQAILTGHSVLFITAANLMLDLGAQESSRALERRLQYYAKIGLLIIDEVGFLAFDNRNADLLFQVVSRRYEKKSLVLTTNLLFGDWHTIFPNATCATALIDRVVHHSDILTIKGDSYRLREAHESKRQRRPCPKSTKSSTSKPAP